MIKTILGIAVIFVIGLYAADLQIQVWNLTNDNTNLKRDNGYSIDMLNYFMGKDPSLGKIINENREYYPTI